MKFQNKQVKHKRFDPLEYFGGCTPKQVETGIIRILVKQMFKEKPDDNSSHHNKSNGDLMKSEQIKAKMDIVNQKSLSKTKLPSFSEISKCFKESQDRIKTLINSKSFLKVGA